MPIVSQKDWGSWERIKPMEIHTSVLLEEAMEYLNIKKGGAYVDATLNGGGHARAILGRAGREGAVFGIERDNAIALRIEKEKIDGLVVDNANYINMENILQKHTVTKIDGVLFDFGMSSWHVDSSGRGFSFAKDEPLDMRYEPSEGIESAAAVINSYTADTLADIFKEYGEERYAQRIARKIVEARHEKRITTSGYLAWVVASAVPRRGKTDPATRVFQALRIYVNRELDNVRTGVEVACRLVVPQGRVVAISFHSLEDRIVKELFRKTPGRIITKKPIVPERSEVIRNPRARSARLRAWEKT